jgi:hypothetical protein
LRKPNYRQQKKAKEDARKARQVKKQERRLASAQEAPLNAELSVAPRTPLTDLPD